MSEKKAKGPGGRPTTYSEELSAQICAMISDGMSVREICRMEGMPAASTVFLWLGKHPEFSERYTLACEARAYYLAEDLLDIADDGTNDWMERRDPDGNIVGWSLNGEHVQRSKLRVDTRKWLLSKLQPKKYGEKVAVTDPDGGPLQVVIKRFGEG